MLENLLLTAALMGWAGGPHCLVMCGAPCTAVARAGAPHSTAALAWFQLGRLLGYSILGAMAAAAMQGLGWLTVYSAALRPVWSLFHAFALVMGLWLIWRAELPIWAQALGRFTWQRIQVWARRLGSARVVAPLLTGVLWALLPCGLLYSALVVAALAAHPAQGAGVMAVFALSSGAVLTLGPWVLLRWGYHIRVPNVGMRLAGSALSLSAGAALYLGLFRNQAPWC
ncbi:MAG: sulfite exporter TauE/SafE family protein [Alphaproteobacteria bacterium]|nr:sulfite exporter TauE/SafE family protein [Alphaproteobacteria bacterium]